MITEGDRTPVRYGTNDRALRGEKVGSASIAFTDTAKLDRGVLDELLVRAEALTRD